MPHKVFWTEDTGDVELYLRRYISRKDEPVTPCSFHQAMNSIGRAKAILADECEWEKGRFYKKSPPLEDYKDNPNWPTKCETCDLVFPEESEWQVFQESIYKDPVTNVEYNLRGKHPGMMWHAWWMGDWNRGSDGISLIVTLPNGNEWYVDSRASNCDSPCKHCGVIYHAHTKISSYSGQHDYEDAKPHKCWVRHGDPKTGNLHVDKNGVTCGAGAGSILSGNYHGFLHNGHLTDG